MQFKIVNEEENWISNLWSKDWISPLCKIYKTILKAVKLLPLLWTSLSPSAPHFHS